MAASGAENGIDNESPSLLMKNFPKSWTSSADGGQVEAKLRKLLSTFGQLVGDMMITREPGEPVTAQATFEDPGMATRAMKALHGVDMRTAKEKRESGGRPPAEDEKFWAQPLPLEKQEAEQSEGVQEMETFLYVEGFPTSWTEAQLRITLLAFGGVERLTYIPDSRYGRVARLVLKEPANMERAVQELNGATVGDGEVIEECMLSCKITTASVQRKEEEARKLREEKEARKLYRADVRKRREDKKKGAVEAGAPPPPPPEDAPDELEQPPGPPIDPKEARTKAAKMAAARFEAAEEEQEEDRRRREEEDSARVAAAAYAEAKAEQQRRQDEEGRKAAEAESYQAQLREKARLAAERREKEQKAREEEKQRREEKRRLWETDRMRREEHRQRTLEKQQKAEEERRRLEEERAVLEEQRREEERIRRAEAKAEAERKREEERLRKEEKMRKFEESRMRREEVRTRNEMQREQWEVECMRREEKLQRWVDEQMKIAAEKKRKLEEERKRKHEEEMRKWEMKRMQREEEMQRRLEKALELAAEKKRLREEERQRLREDEKRRRDEEMRRYEESRMRREEELQRWCAKVLQARESAAKKKVVREEERLRKEEKMRRWEEDRMFREEMKQRKEEKRMMREEERLKREGGVKRRREDDPWQEADVAGWASLAEDAVAGQVPSARPKLRAKPGPRITEPQVDDEDDEETELDRLLFSAGNTTAQVPSARPKARARATPQQSQFEAPPVPSARPKQRAVPPRANTAAMEQPGVDDGDDTEPPTDDTEAPSEERPAEQPGEDGDLEPTSMVDTEEEAEDDEPSKTAEVPSHVPSARPKQRARPAKSAEELDADRQAARLEEMYREEQSQRKRVEAGLSGGNDGEEAELARYCMWQAGQQTSGADSGDEASRRPDRRRSEAPGFADSPPPGNWAAAPPAPPPGNWKDESRRYERSRSFDRAHGRDKRRREEDTGSRVPSARPKQRARQENGYS